MPKIDDTVRGVIPMAPRLWTFALAAPSVVRMVSGSALALEYAGTRPRGPRNKKMRPKAGENSPCRARGAPDGTRGGRAPRDRALPRHFPKVQKQSAYVINQCEHELRRQIPLVFFAFQMLFSPIRMESFSSGHLLNSWASFAVMKNR